MSQDNIQIQPCDVTGQPCDVTGQPCDVTGQQCDVTGQPCDVTGQPCDVTGASTATVLVLPHLIKQITGEKALQSPKVASPCCLTRS